MDHRCAIRKAEQMAMDKQPSGREDYVRKVLEAYRNTPGTCGNPRRPDRLLALQLYQRGIPLTKSRTRSCSPRYAVLSAPPMLRH